MRPSSLKPAARFLLKFLLISALLLALWPPFSWVYGPLLGSAANVSLTLIQPYVSLEVGEETRFVYHIWPDTVQCKVEDFGAVYLNALVVVALLTALPADMRGRLRALGLALLALFASHTLCVYLLACTAIWNSLSDPAHQASVPNLTARINSILPHRTGSICGRVYALWGAYGWEGIPFLAGALTFGKVRGLFREKRPRPSPVARPRHRKAPTGWGPSPRAQWGGRPQPRRGIPYTSP